MIPFKNFSSPRKFISIRRIIAPYTKQVNDRKLIELQATEKKRKQTLLELAK